MKKYFMIAVLCALGPLELSAGCSSCGNTSVWPSYNNFEIDVGYRRDKITTKASGQVLSQDLFETSPELLLTSSAEENWHNLGIIQVEGTANLVSSANYAVKINGDYGYVYSGDYDYRSIDEYLNLFSSDDHDVKGHVYDVSAGVGYRMTSTGGRCTATPYVGYAYRGQNLHQKTTELELCYSPPGISCDNGLRVTDFTVDYKPRWFGPWIGIDFDVQVETCAYAFAGFEWHLVQYNASETMSFNGTERHQNAHGQGYIITLGGNWEIWNAWSIGLIGHYRNFRVWNGNQRTTVLDLEGDYLISKSQFNRAQWISGDVAAMIAWRF